MTVSLRSRLVAYVACGIAISFATSGWAIGPEFQLIDPTFDPVVRILHDSKPHDVGDGYFAGTGTIVDHHNRDGEGWLCVLTADHVVSRTGEYGGARVSKPGIAFGNSAEPITGNSPYLEAAPNFARYGDNGTSDLAVLRVNYGAYDPAYDALVRNLIPTTAFHFFTAIGYGNEGQLVDLANNGTGAPGADGINDGYESQDMYGIQRYMNDKVATIATVDANFEALGYTYEEAVIWYVDNPLGPEDWAGSGTTYDADSGAPYFSDELDYDDVNNLLYYTDDQFAVHAGTIRPDLVPESYKPFIEINIGGTTYDVTANYGVALTQADIDWIHWACEVPEPATWAIAVVIALALAPGLRNRV